MKHLLPDGWPRPSGYSNGILAEGKLVFVAGMVGWDQGGKFETGLVNQFRKILDNTVATLGEGGATPADIVRMTWYVKDLDDYRDNLAGIGQAYRDVIGSNYPVMAVIGVSDLVERDALIEIETTAVIEGST
jgi:enamine deaminase RidA (YjgF/YER057c/UK114 family)